MFRKESNALITTEAVTFFESGEPVGIIAARHVPMLVPAELYNPGKERDYLSLQFDASMVGRTFSDDVGPYKAVYSLTQNDVDTLSRLPFLQRPVSETTLAFRMLDELDTASAIFIGHSATFFDVAVTGKKEPLLANRFLLTEPADILYYLLNIIRQFNLRSPELLLHFHGEEDKKLVQLLKTHLIKPVILES